MKKKKKEREREKQKKKVRSLDEWIIQQVKKTRRQVFFTKAYYAKHSGVLLRKHYKEGASVVTQFFFINVLINFQKNPKIAKNIENPKKIYIFNIFASFLAFLASSQKNLNFQRYLERVRLLMHHF
jgi:hypothetical protein